MDDPPALSALANGSPLEADPGQGIVITYLDALAAWNNSLETYLGAIWSYMREAGNAGQGRRWAAAEDLLVAVETTCRNFIDNGREITALMAASDAAESALRTLKEAASIALDPSVLAGALAGMSRTYSENLKGLGRRVLEAESAANTRYNEACAAAASTGASATSKLTIEDITAAYNERAGRGGVSTELYISALFCRAKRQDASAALCMLENTKGLAFGLVPDTPAAATADTAALAEYHPLQAMSYAPVPFGESREEPVGDATSLGLPQARLAITYDLAPLINRRRALAHGPLASTTKGLDFRLIERLRTIRAEPYRPSASAPGLHRADTLSAPLTVTTDGRTARTFEPAPGTSSWAPFAGSHPRVEAHSAAEAAVILAAIRLDQADGWGLNLREQYERAIRENRLPINEFVSSALLEALNAEFEKAYDAAPPETPHDFRELVAPTKAPGPGAYFYSAAARLGFNMLDEQLRALLIRVTMGRIPHAVIVREARMTQAIQSFDAGQNLWKRFRKAYRPDLEAFALPGGSKKTGLMKAFHRIATEVVREGPLDCSPPTLKLFAAMLPRTF